MALRAAGGALLVVGFALFAVNVLATALQRKPVSRPAPAAPAPATGS
jgi:cbb3-type cytochrome oxidase subunit 1